MNGKTPTDFQSTVSAPEWYACGHIIDLWHSRELSQYFPTPAKL